MKKISKLCCLFACLCLTACDDITSTFTPTKGVTNLLRNAKDPLEIKNDLTRNEDFKSFLNNYTDFSLKFNDSYLSRYDNRLANVAISPLSLFFALSMTSECASNNSQKEILNALNMTSEELQQYIPILYSLENTSTYSYDEMGNATLSSTKELNNSLWFSKELNKFENTLDVLANYYHVSSYETDFLNNNAKANEDFKSYVKDKTHDLITPSFDLEKQTLLVLLNTLYLKDVWNELGNDLPFTDSEYPFYSRSHDCSIAVSRFMKGKYISGRVLRTESYSSFFTKTYNGLKIHFLTPNNSYTLDDVFNKENIENILDLNNYEYKNDELKTEYYTSTYFPSFEASCDEDLKDLLSKDFKISEIFTGQANFSNITSDEMLISKVMHQTKLKIERKGIEGAAITAVIGDASSSIPTDKYKSVYEEFIVDKAFGYVITDRYGVTLFSGVVNDIM